MSCPIKIPHVTQNDPTIYYRICNGNMKEGMEGYNRQMDCLLHMSFNINQ